MIDVLGVGEAGGMAVEVGSAHGAEGAVCRNELWMIGDQFWVPPFSLNDPLFPAEWVSVGCILSIR